MKPKYHINNEGAVGLCKATERTCPYVEHGHYDSKIEADKAAYNMFGTNYTPPFILDKINELSNDNKIFEKDMSNEKNFIFRSFEKLFNLFKK